MQTTVSTTLQILLTRFNGQVLIPFITAAESVGISQQTARNRLVNRSFPIKTVLIGSRRFVHIADLAEYVESLREQPTKSRRGRPTKASKYQTQHSA